MMKAFIYKLYPTKTQVKSLEEMLTTCRYWYNTCLAERKEAYEQAKKTISKNEQLRKVKELKTSNPYAHKVHSHVLQNVVQDLDKAFKAFFRRIKAGETPGYPRFKGKNRWKSFGFKEYGNGFKIDGRRLKLFGVGRVAVRWHRPIEGKIKTVRILKKAGIWYACFACEVESKPLPPTGKEIGIDVGITSLITTSDGNKIENPRWYRYQQRKLRVLQRRVSRRKLGSYNRCKAVLALQRHHEYIASARQDFLDKLVYWLITNYDRIALEDLRITNMVKNHKLSKSILDAGWGYLIQRLLDKAEEAGRVVNLVNPAYTSKKCSNCGFLFEHLSLKDRWINCSCGFSGCRDWNASLNLLGLGRSLWELSSTRVGFS
jgi:putative transposase